MPHTQTTTRQKLIETATDLICRNSYGTVSVDEICTKAGVQKGSFYHFFPSKADLALEVIEWCIQQTIAEYDDIFSIKHDPLKRLSLMVTHLYDKQREKQKEFGYVCGCPIMTLGSELSSKQTELAAKVKEICKLKLAYIESTLRDLIARKEISQTTDINRKAEEIFTLIVGQLFIARINNNLEFIKNDLNDVIIDLIGVRNKTFA